MGMESNVYVGPYIEVPKVDLTTQSKTTCCSNPACRTKAPSPDARFCAKCGSPIEGLISSKTKKAYPRAEDVDGRFEDCVSCYEGLPDDIWLTNQDNFGFTFTSYQDNKPRQLNFEKAQQDLEAFKAQYADLFEAFLAKYGCELVARYGVVEYYS